jgi:DNA-binding GntR family transcriptional regulator
VGVIVNDIKGRIERGDLSPGEQLPATRELAEQYQSTARSVHTAIAMLKATGHIRTEPGRGVYVANTRLTGVNRIDNNLNGQIEADTPRRTVEMPKRVRDLLNLEPGEECVLRSRRVRDQGRVVQYGFSWVHPRIAEVVPEIDTIGELIPSYQAVYQERSGQVLEQETMHMARLSTSEDMAMFDLDKVAAVSVGRNIYSDDEGVVGVGEVAYEPGSELPVRRA